MRGAEMVLLREARDVRICILRMRLKCYSCSACAERVWAHLFWRPSGLEGLNYRMGFDD
jgi:hypothetical protein